MAEHPNAIRIRQLIEAINAGQPGIVMEMIDENAVFYVPGESPIAGTFRGKAAIGRFFGHLAQLSEAPLSAELLYLLTSGDEYVVAIWKAHGVRKGWNYVGIAGYLFQLRAGKIIEARNLQENQAEIDHFWSL